MCETLGKTVMRTRLLRVLIRPNQDLPPFLQPLAVCRRPAGRVQLLDDATGYGTQYVPRGYPINGENVVVAARGEQQLQVPGPNLDETRVGRVGEETVRVADLRVTSAYGVKPYDIGAVVDVVVARDGSVGWIGCIRTRGRGLFRMLLPGGQRHRFRNVGNPRGPTCQEGAVRGVYVAKRKRSAFHAWIRVDSGVGVVVGSLRLADTTMTWTKDRQTRRAAL